MAATPAYWGGEGGKPVPILVAGRDFGLVVDAPPVLAAASKRPAAMWNRSRLSCLSGGFSQRQSMPQAAPSFGQPLPISRSGRAGRPFTGRVFDTPTPTPNATPTPTPTPAP